jgi:hypothetical protein
LMVVGAGVCHTDETTLHRSVGTCIAANVF